MARADRFQMIAYRAYVPIVLEGPLRRFEDVPRLFDEIFQVPPGKFPVNIIQGWRF